ncbi:MAG TPA: EamA family transporter, partial [Acidobacteriaceae bacterium]
WTPLVYAGLPLALSIAAGKLRMVAVVGVGAMLVLLNGSLPLGPERLLWTLPVVAAVGLQGWSLGYARRQGRAASSLGSVMLQCLTAGAGLLVAAALAREAALPGVRSWTPVQLVAAAGIVVLATAAAYPLYYRMLAVLEPAQAAGSQWLQTVVAVAEAAWLLGQRPRAAMAGAALMLVGCTVLLVRRDVGSESSGVEELGLR